MRPDSGPPARDRKRHDSPDTTERVGARRDPGPLKKKLERYNKRAAARMAKGVPSSQLEECPICLDDVEKSKMVKLCKRGKVTHEICQGCFLGMGVAKGGKFACPFDRRKINSTEAKELIKGMGLSSSSASSKSSRRSGSGSNRRSGSRSQSG